MDKLIIRKLIDAIGRFCLAAVFVIAIPVKIKKFSEIVESISRQGIPEALAPILLVGAIACLISGSILLVFGKDQKLGAALLLILLLVALGTILLIGGCWRFIKLLYRVRSFRSRNSKILNTYR